MVDKTKQCNVLHKMVIRLNNFLYVFNLRQGTILIAVHQIALSSFLLVILLVGISHVGSMLSMLHHDMEDDADRRGYEVVYGEHSLHDGDVVSTNNQRRFAKAQHLASATVMFLYTSTILTSIYLMCCFSLLHGAVKYKREYVMPWIMAACVGIVLLVIIMIIGDSYPCIISLFGGHKYYQLGCTLVVVTYLYAICAVSSYALETDVSDQCARHNRSASDERGERLLLLDHAAHSSLLSAAQLNKLNSGTQSQFV